MIFIVVIGLVVVAAPALSRLYSADVAISRDKLRVARVERGDLLRDVAVQGSIVAANSPTLYAPSAGVVTVKVKAGDAVERGDVLALIDSPELESRHDQERAKVDELEIEVARQSIQSRTLGLEARQRADMAQVDLEVAGSNLSRAQVSVDRGLISRAEYEQALVVEKKAALVHRQAARSAELATETLAFELKVKQLQLDRQRFLAEELTRQVAELAIRAPTIGIVGSVNVRENDSVLANAALATVIDLSAFEVQAEVPEVYVDDLSTGMQARIRFNGNDHAGTLIAISPEVVAGKVVARIAFDEEPPAGLRQNQRVTASIIVENKQDVLKVRRGDFVDSGGGRITYVVEDDLALRMPIEIGARGTGEVEILSGLREGQEIVVSGLSELNGEDAVHITD
ncbi:efflux RND transporter periplasmic adaptor subunit [Aquimonas sp.]|uniref:efflux RND transporter periplasmic adaptor subunit n=1 Tax=Aquimonas sp. TaxID=1872588 RepID=UPI0037BFD381